MTAIPLSRLLAVGRPDDAPVADGVTFARFRADVAGNAARLKGCRRGLLVAADAYWGAVGLLALLHAGAEVTIPPNAQPGTLTALTADGAVPVGGDLRPGGEGPGGEEMALTPLDPETPLTFFTSGSTGEPKRVVRTLGMLEAEALATEAVLGRLAGPTARVHATVPHQHVYGLNFRLLWPLVTGRPFASTMHELWETVPAALDAGSVLVTSPAHLTRLSGIAPLPPSRRPALVLSAGAPLPEPAAREAAAVFGTAVTEIFGSTETGAIAHRRREGGDPPWRPLPGVVAGRNPEGRLRVGAAHVEGREHVGSDLVEMAGDGGFRVLGRADRIAKVEGKRVSLPEVEAQLRRSPLVADAAVLTLEQLCAVVVPSAEGAARLEEIGAFRFGRSLRRELSAVLEPAGLPRRWRFVNRLPDGALGKRRHADIAALFEEATLSEAVLSEAVLPEMAGPRSTAPDVRAVRSLADGVELDLFIPGNLVQLDGHFPGMPIVPGVAQIDWAVMFANTHLGLGIEAAQALQVKFRRVTVPDTLVTLALRHAPARRRLSFEYRCGDETLSSGSIGVEGIAP